MDIYSIAARLASGLAVRAAVAVAALYAGHAAWNYVADVFARAGAVL